MNYRVYLMQKAQRGKVINTGGALRIMNKQSHMKRSFSGSTGQAMGRALQERSMSDKLQIQGRM
jgi:hypothetical protein